MEAGLLCSDEPHNAASGDWTRLLQKRSNVN